MRQNAEITRMNMLNFLNEVYSLTNNDYVNISLSKIARNHSISNINSQTIIKSKIVDYKNGVKWNTIKPNVKMVDKLSGFNRQYNLQYSDATVIQDKKRSSVKNVEITKQQKHISIFWGMFNFKF